MQDHPLFHPLVAEWFAAKYGRPTQAQELAWPRIAAGENVLVTAPTGTGKTFAAFLWALDKLIRGDDETWSAGTVRLLYVSPLKALNTDIGENLVGPLEELKILFHSRGLPFPDLRVRTRSGDTSQEDRRRMLKRPPEILISTPESLGILLLSPAGRDLFSGLRCLILDEIHALLPEKRGTLLASAVENLVLTAGEFQRVALSATLRDPGEALAFVGGFMEKTGSLVPRPVSHVDASSPKRFDLGLEYLNAAFDARGETPWERLAERLKAIVLANRATLVFVNNRRAAEKLAHLINQGEEERLVYAHHGSLAREIRAEVESRLREGRLRGIVATSSLELGIDIGELDRVVLVETPFSVSSAVQRIGRAGHRVGETSRGLFLPLHGGDLAAAAAMLPLVLGRDIEPLKIPHNPLDVLAQTILALAVDRVWKKDDLHRFLRRAYPYRDLPREAFERVLDMLAGRYASSRVKELAPRLRLDDEAGTVQALPGARLALYAKGGAIPERGYFKVRVQGSGAVLGEVDEEFVWERRIGDRFHFGSRGWKIAAIGSQAVEVVPWEGPENIFVFYKGDALPTSFHFAERHALFLEDLDSRLGKPGLAEALVRERGMTGEAAEALLTYLESQREATGTSLPHRHRLLVERTVMPGSGEDLEEFVLHAPFGGAVTFPLALALKALFRDRGIEAEAYADSGCAIFFLPAALGFDPAFPGLLKRLAAENIEKLLLANLADSGFFGARFRENAGRALLLPDAGFDRRMPFWLLRLKSKRLLETVQGLKGFPILAETFRECLEDLFDIKNLKFLLGEIADGVIRIDECSTPRPSPFARGVLWKTVNTLMYAEDGQLPAGKTGAEDLASLLLASGEPAASDEEDFRDFASRLSRTAPGFAPETPEDLAAWVQDRVLLSREEWECLLDRAGKDGAVYPEDEAARAYLAARIVEVRLPGARLDARTTVLNLALLGRVFGLAPRVSPDLTGRTEAALAEAEVRGLPDPEDLFLVWLSYHAALPEDACRALWGLSEERLATLVEELLEDGKIVRGRLVKGRDEILLATRDNFERLLRFARKRRREAVTSRPLRDLAPFLSSLQGIGAESPGEPEEVLERLLAFPADAEDWESRLLPARFPSYDPSILDRLLAGSGLEWAGVGEERIAFRPAEDHSLFAFPKEKAALEVERTFRDSRAKYDFRDLEERLGLSGRETARLLWQEVWRGRLAADSFEPVRSGIQTDFAAKDLAKPREEKPGRFRGLRSYGAALRKAAPREGLWRLLPDEEELLGSLEALELAKDRARLLLGRYGILFRDLLKKELPGFRWQDLFPALRLLDLSGEVLSGAFFEGLSGYQFASAEAVQRLSVGPGERLFVLNSRDPASLAGLGFPGLPKRLAGTDLVYRGAELLLVSENNGERLDFRIPAEEKTLQAPLASLLGFLGRRLKSAPIRVEEINGLPARTSPYKPHLLAFGFKDFFKDLQYWPPAR